jgi:hypothetical protein
MDGVHTTVIGSEKEEASGRKRQANVESSPLARRKENWMELDTVLQKHLCIPLLSELDALVCCCVHIHESGERFVL